MAGSQVQPPRRPPVLVCAWLVEDFSHYWLDKQVRQGVLTAQLAATDLLPQPDSWSQVEQVVAAPAAVPAQPVVFLILMFPFLILDLNSFRCPF
jgi:hypothetical protein